MMPTALKIFLLLALLLLQVGCATTESDLDYTRDTSSAPKSGDNSYHGWNNANN
jgi:hypothetical protein